MIDFFKKPYRWAVLYTLLLLGAFSYVLLDTLVIPKSYASVQEQNQEQTQSQEQLPNGAAQGTDAEVTANTYADENIQINIETVRDYNTTYYVADILLKDAAYLKTALAENTFGRNIKDTTSDIARDNNSIFAINGDYYGFRNNGYVLRNGTLYRDTRRNGSSTDDLVITKDGNFSIIDEANTDVDDLNLTEVSQILSFGPALVKNGRIAVDENSEVSQSKNSNPRTAIGQISELHYIVIVSDGRTDESEGLSLQELAKEMQERGCTTAYNLDGGGSSTMYFNGTVINNPTDGRTSGERQVSDIVYIGY